MQTTLSSKVLRLAAVAPILLALAGCSSGSSGGGTPSSSSSTSPSTSASNSSSNSSSSKTSGSSSSVASSSVGTSSSASSSSVADGGSDAGDAGLTTFAMVYTDIIAGHCAGCHHPANDAGAAGGGVSLGALDMSTVDAGYANLVGIPAGGTGIPGFEDAGQKVCDTLADAGLLRVAPGDAGGSLLCNKVNPADVPPATPPCGDPMPLLSFPLAGDAGPSQAQIFNEIKTWINESAKP